MTWVFLAIMLIAAALQMPDSMLGSAGNQARWILAGIGALFLMSALVSRLVAPARQNEKQRKDWPTGRGEVLDVAETGTYVERQPQLRVRLRVQHGNSPPYEVTIVKLFSRTDAPNIKVGRTLPLRIDPTDSTNVFVETENPPHN